MNLGLDMKINKVIAAIVLLLSFCVFDQMKDHLVEKVGASATIHQTSFGSIENVSELIPANLIKTDIVRCEIKTGEEDRIEQDNRLISISLGEKICKAILLSEF